ncbi:putative Histidine kinase [Candidatus Sulfopaludibacter sp. SbA3]|nr:putative Histidine kinase [Candidatus Sulfopaludibacter sp. SbA3]
MPAVTETLLYAGVGITAGWLTRIHGSLAGASQEISPAPGGRHRDNAFLGAQGAGEIPSPNQIVAGLVHRFRTPVSSIEGAVSLLEDRRLPEEKRVEFLRIIQKESHQLDRALSDILDYTQPRKGKWRMVDLSQLVDQVIERSGLKEHDPYFLIRKDIAPDMPRPNCDPEQVGNMLLNLVMNSIQAPPGGGQVVVAARPDADNVVITVKDHGCGIAPDIIARVFDPFFTTRENGLGLGLTVARQIAVAHCGNIMVIGSSEKGTCVSVRLPLNPPNPHEQRPHIGS